MTVQKKKQENYKLYNTLAYRWSGDDEANKY
jgi:hypothetical protein